MTAVQPGFWCTQDGVIWHGLCVPLECAGYIGWTTFSRRSRAELAVAELVRLIKEDRRRMFLRRVVYSDL